MNSKKTFFDNEPTINLQDKWLVLTAGNNNDFKVSYNSLIEELKRDLLRPYLEQQVGNLIINAKNSKKGVKKFNDGYLEYLLCDNSEYFLEDYPLLKNHVASFKDEQGREKFKSLDSINRTIKGATSAVNIGTTEEDAIKSHAHGMGHDHGMSHDHDMQHNHVNSMLMPYKNGDRGYGQMFWTSDQRNSWWWDDWRTTAASSRARTGGSREKTDWSRANTDSVGESETRMKNFAVNMYLVAGVMIKGV
jgi:hypothetical protein